MMNETCTQLSFFQYVEIQHTIDKDHHKHLDQKKARQTCIKISSVLNISKERTKEKKKKRRKKERLERRKMLEVGLKKI